MQCAPTYQLTLAWVQEPDLLWRPSMVSRRTMCPKEVVERCFAVPVISAIGRVYTRPEGPIHPNKNVIVQISWWRGRGAHL